MASATEYSTKEFTPLERGNLREVNQWFRRRKNVKAALVSAALAIPTLMTILGQGIDLWNKLFHP